MNTRRPTSSPLVFTVPFLSLVVVACVVVRCFSPDDFLDTWQKKCDAAKVDRMERQDRLTSGVDTVDDAMNRFVKHEFLGYENMKPVNGWIMTTESGKTFHRASLQRQAELFEVLGCDAVTDLIKWTHHDQMEIRYIANFSLTQITGLKPQIPTFATLQELHDGGWLADATATYENWASKNLDATSAR